MKLLLKTIVKISLTFFLFIPLKIGDLKGAERYFANSTRYNLYVPGVWFYLAIINFKMGENYKALECWRYARLVCSAYILHTIIILIIDLY